MVRSSIELSRSYWSSEVVMMAILADAPPPACNLIPPMNSFPEHCDFSKVTPSAIEKVVFSFPLLFDLVELTLVVPSKLVQNTLTCTFLYADRDDDAAELAAPESLEPPLELLFEPPDELPEDADDEESALF